jgi:hypothetical protein
MPAFFVRRTATVKSAGNYAACCRSAASILQPLSNELVFSEKALRYAAASFLANLTAEVKTAAGSATLQ